MKPHTSLIRNFFILLYHFISVIKNFHLTRIWWVEPELWKLRSCQAQAWVLLKKLTQKFFTPSNCLSSLVLFKMSTEQTMLRLITRFYYLWTGEQNLKNFLIRSPSSMAISWSYVHSEFWLLWKKNVIPPFLKKRQLFVLHIYFFRII